MNLIQALEAFYKAEINIQISTFWDGGWDVKIGDASNGYKAEEVCFYSLQELADWMMEQYEILGLGESNESP